MPESSSAIAQPASGEPVPAPASALSDLFWRIMATLMFCALAMVGWLVWNLMPSSVVTEAAWLVRQHSGRGGVPSAGSPSAPGPVIAAGAHPASGREVVGAITAVPTPAPGAAPSAPDAAKAPAGQPLEPAQADKPPPDMLRLETRINTPIRERTEKAAPAGENAKTKTGKGSTGSVPTAR
jgi:hypothetical protein